MRRALILVFCVCMSGCTGDIVGPGQLGDSTIDLPSPACEAAPGGGSNTVAAPELSATLADRWHEAWQSSPAVADIDGDGTAEILAPRESLMLGWHADGTEVFRAEVGGRIWSSPVVADLVPELPGLEVAVGARANIHVWDAQGNDVPGFPYEWRDESRSIAAGDVDGDGAFEIVATTTGRLEANGQRDFIIAVNMDGTTVLGFPPNTTGAADCDDFCFVTGGYDQNIALGDVNGDGIVDILASQDNAYISLHDGTGLAFDAAPIFDDRTKFSGIRMMLDYDLAKQGFADDESTQNQGHFTNTAPLLADIDGDSAAEIVLLGSVQNAAQSDRERGVALWVLENDGTRPPAWEAPYHAADYLAGLWDFEGTNVVGATNQVAAADIDPSRPGVEMVFAGFDGRIRAVDSDAQEMWVYTYTTDGNVLTGGAVIADLSSDGVPEIVFNTYSTDENRGELVILDAGGSLLHALALPGRGAMPVPTVADADGDGVLDIVVSLKDGEDGVQQVLIYSVASAADNCSPWATGRGNLRRDGYIPPN